MDDYSIRLDVLRALVAERKARISEAMATEEAKAIPDADLINALDAERAGLPNWGTYRGERTIDVEIGRWRAIVEGQAQ